MFQQQALLDGDMILWNGLHQVQGTDVQQLLLRDLGWKLGYTPSDPL
jgi:hypothetical protein